MHALLETQTLLELSGLILAAILTSVATRRSSTEDWATMPLSFVIDFASLLLLGPHATMLVVGAGAVTKGFSDSHSQPLRRMFSSAATLMVATQAAGLAHRALGGTLGQFTWPQQGLPIAAAVLAYCLVKSALAEIVVPFFTTQPVERSWPKSILRGGPSYCVGASLAVGLVEVIDHRNWQVLPVAIVVQMIGLSSGLLLIKRP